MNLSAKTVFSLAILLSGDAEVTYRIMLLLDLAILLLVLASSVWVLIDASNLGIKAEHNKPAWKRGFLEYGPVGHFLVCLGLWAVGFPAYLVRRRRHLAKVPASQVAGGGLYADCPHCGTRLSLSADLLGRAVACPACQHEFNSPGVRPQSRYRGQGPMVAGWAVYAVVLLCVALVFSQTRFEDLWRAARGPGSTVKTATLELKVRKAIQDRLANNSVTANTTIKKLTLIRQSDGFYQGTLLTQTGDRTEENEVSVNYENGDIRWQILPRHAAEARTLEWNRTDPDALKNGNFAAALQKIARNPDCRTDAVAPTPALVIKALPDYYEKPLQISGKVYGINSLSADSSFGKALGGKLGSEILFVCGDKTVVDMLCTTANPKVRSGDSVTVYGFAVGTTRVPNPAGGVVTRLVLVGPECDAVVPR